MKIHSIEADNFKLFTTNFHKIQDITNAEMILFNGPNGYGKTSVFDIIEFCLTGEIKRISDYSDKLAIAKNEKFENKILISDETKKAFVKLGLEDKGQKIEICYSYNPIEKKKGGSKENNPHNIFDCFTRTIVCDGKGVQNQEELLKRLQFDDTKEIFDNLIYFAEHKTECANFLFNIPYQNLIKDFNGDKNISYTQYPLEYSYRFIGLVKQVEVLEEKYQREKKAQLILKNIQEKQYEDLNWLFIQEEKLLDDDSITIIKQQLGVISNLRKAQGILQNAMTALGQSRENLVKNANAAMEAGGISDKQCPLCGAPYSDRDELDSKIKEETELLSDISDDSVIIIQNIRNQIYNNYLKKVEKTIQEILADVVTEEMYQSLQDAKKYGSQILEVERILEKIGVGLNRKDNESIVEGYNNLLTKVKEALKYIPKEVEIQLESRKFIECYERFYSKEEQRFIAVDVEKLRNKKKYIETLNYNFYVAELSKKKGELEHIQKRIDKLHELIIELQGYQSALKEGIQEYKKKIISDIEPLLHIYTAKILQQKFNGKSIYIHTSEDVEDIQFVNSPQDNQDILYSMSSGQLSAVALSFLLCMNQAYGAHKACSILLIDDPVQTIDDVNMVGLVDILRYGFGDRQIFISTHEQSFEWFLRYRYSKAGKNVKIFNMKDIMLQEE